MESAGPRQVIQFHFLARSNPTDKERPLYEEGPRIMAEKRKIKAKHIVTDLRAGLTNAELMEKHRLSAKGLVSIFTKLADAKAVRPGELEGRISSVDDTVELDDFRKEARCYPIMNMQIVDMDDLDSEHLVVDMSEAGIHISGITASVGDRSSFLFKPSGFSESTAVSFEAECRWTKPSEGGLPSEAGYRITEISDENMNTLRQLIGSATLCDGS
jgi:PilZ domain